jgi:hypothetical protein
VTRRSSQRDARLLEVAFELRLSALEGERSSRSVSADARERQAATRGSPETGMAALEPRSEDALAEGPTGQTRWD